MLYLEDYLEMIEHLPQELRDRFTEMREMDLSVQNSMDSLDRRSRSFFSQCKKGELQGPQADNEFEILRKDYYKVLEDADEKVSLANQMHELVERYLRRLDSELFKFKCELEADNNGITEILEKRSLELDSSSTMMSTGNQKENRFFGAISNNSHGQKDNRYRQKPEKRRDSSGGNSEKKQNVSAALAPPSSAPVVRPTTPNIGTHSVLSSSPSSSSVAYNLQHMGAGNAIAAAASQAIVATQQMQQGRRTASLKASYEAIHGASSSNPNEILIGRELVGATHNAIQAVEREGNALHGQKRHKKKISGNLSHTSSSSSSSTIPSSATTSQINATAATVDAAPVTRINENGMIVEQTPEGEWTYDPNEPRYCICNQVSYGDMVACDNEACPFEWFHYPCVGITQSPKGKWYCPKCTASMRRRGNRKN